MPQVAIPLLISLLLHGLIVLLMVLNLSFAKERRVVAPDPVVIQARLVSLESQAVARAAAPEPQPAPRPEPAPQPAPQSRPDPAPAPQPQTAPPRPDPAKLEEQKRAEQKKREEEARQKAEAERKKREEAERKRREEAERKRREEEAARKRREEAERRRQEEQAKKALAEAIAAEEAAMAAQQEGQLVQGIADLIRVAVERSWSRPPSARTGMRTLLAIQLSSSGEVVGVSVVRSSGNAEFDQSAINAVRRASPFEEVRKLPAGAFERRLRQFQLDFYPEDLRL